MIPETHTFELGGKQFTLRKLSFHQSLPVYCRFQELLAVFLDEDASKKAGELAIFQLVGLAGKLNFAELDYYIKAFGPSTTVDFADGRVLALKVVPATKSAPEVDPLSELFTDNLPDMFKWLDACVRFNFGGTIEKTASALKEPGRAGEGEAPAA